MVLIKGEKMPRSCEECFYLEKCTGLCPLEEKMGKEEVTLTYDEIMSIISESEYELMDGHGFGLTARKMNLDEYNAVKGTTRHIEKAINDYCWEKAVREGRGEK